MTITISVLGVALVLSIIIGLYVLVGAFIVGTMDAGFNWEGVLFALIMGACAAGIVFCLAYVILTGLVVIF